MNKLRSIQSVKRNFLISILLLTILLGFTLQQSEQQTITLRLGYTAFSFREVNPSDASTAVKIYADTFKERVTKRYQKPAFFNSTIFESLNQIEEAFKKGELDLLSLNSDEYFKLKKDFNIYPFLTVTATEDAFEKYILIVRKDLKITSLSDLRGKRLSIPNPDYNPILNDWLYNYFTKNKMPEIDRMFSQVKTLDKESNAVYDVFFKNADCTVIRKKVFMTLCELNPQLNNSLSILVSSKPMVLTFVAANSSSDKKLMNTILEEISDFHLTASGKNILNIFKAKKWIRVNEKDLESVKEILDENAVYKKTNNFKKNNKK